jgi:flagellar hook protein FlgE
MGLGSVMNTALSGMSAATTLIDVTANNLANSQTPGFKASRGELATLPFLTLPGNANPIQVGRGVMVAGTSIDFEQGLLETSDQPALLALDGEGLFILEGESGERLYTRDSQFTLSSTGELLARGGYNVLGFGLADDGSLDTSELVPLRIRPSSHVADEHGRAATLLSFAVKTDGRILGRYSDGRYRPLGQLRLARFPNQAGLTPRAGNVFRASPASGLPRDSNPGDDGAAQVVPGGTELSNVDVARELTKLQLAENQFRANLFVMHTADSLLDLLFFPWRIR